MTANHNISKHPTHNERRGGMLSWLWLVVLLACLAWVLGFTVLASHTAVMRRKIYTALELRSDTPEKAAARLWTYLVGFLIVPAAMSWLVLLSMGGGGGAVDLPKPTTRLVRSYQWQWKHVQVRLSWLEGLVMFLILATQVATLVSRIRARFEVSYWPAERIWYEVSKTTGKLVAFNLMLVLLPVSKSCFWWSVWNYEFERVLKWHRWIAWWLVGAVGVHAVTAVAALLQAGQLVSCAVPNEDCHRPGGFENYLGLQTSRTIMYGWLSVVLGAVLVVTSIPYVRRRHFEVFYYTHVIVFVPLLVVLHLHYPDLIYYMAPGLAAYLMDKVRWYALSRRSTRIVAMTRPAPGFVRLEIAVDDTHKLGAWEPGQWVQINIPAVSFWEWHPMSVAAGPTSTIETTTATSGTWSSSVLAGPTSTIETTTTSGTLSSSTNTIQIDIKVLGNWTAKLADLAQRFDASQVAHSSIYLDTFYGSCHSRAQGFLTHPVVVILAGGIGVTPGMSALRDMIQHSQTKYPHVRKVVFGWCVKKLSVVELYRTELAYYQQRLSLLESGCELEIIVHATLSEKEDVGYGGISGPPQSFQRLDFVPLNNIRASLQRRKERAFLCVLAGCGCWSGIVLSNTVTRRQSWNDASSVMFQLFLLCSCTILTVAAGLFLCSFIDMSSASEERHAGLQSCAPTRAIEEEEGPFELDIVIGKRPDAHKLFRRLRKFCRANGFRSVGVSVCGPQLLVDSAFDASRKYSTDEVEFVMDEESFDW